MHTLNRPSIAALSLLLVASMACTRTPSSESGPTDNTVTFPTKELTQVTFATSKNVWSSLPLVAKEKGFFEEEGLEVSFAFQTAGKYNMDALISKSADFATVVEVNVAYLGFTGDEELSIIASVVESTSCAILADRTAGIDEPADLIGKELGLSPGTGGELFAYRFLEQHDIPRDKVSIRNLQPLAIQPAVASRDIPAVATWEPFIFNSKKALGDDAVVFRSPEAYTGYMLLGTRKEWASKNQETVSAMLRALSKAAEFITSDPMEAKSFLAKELGVSDELIEDIWPFFNIALTYELEKVHTATRDVGVLVNETQDSFKDKDLPDYSTYFDDSFFESLKPQLKEAA